MQAKVQVEFEGIEKRKPKLVNLETSNWKSRRVAFNLIKQAVICLSNDFKAVFKKADDDESDPPGKTQLKAILDNTALSEKQ